MPCANHTKAHESKCIERKENIAMTTQTLTRPKADETEKKIKKLRELYFTPTHRSWGEPRSNASLAA